MKHIIGLIVCILMVVLIGVAHIMDGTNPWLAILGMYGWAIVGVDCLVKIE